MVAQHAGVVLLAALCLLAAGLAVVAVRGRPRNPVPATALSVMLVGITVWTGFDLAVVTTGPAQPWLGLLVGGKYAGAGTCVAGFVVVAVSMAGTGWVPSLRARLLLAVDPVLSALLGGTFAWQGLLLRPVPGVDPGYDDGWRYGPLFWLHTGWSYVAVLVGVVVLGFGSWQLPRGFRRQGVMIAVAPLPAVVLNVLAIVGRSSLPRWFAIDPTAVGLAVGAPLLAVAVLGSDLVVMPSVARSLVLARLPDALVTLSREGRVLDANPAGVRLVRALGGDRVVGAVAPAVLTDLVADPSSGLRDLRVGTVDPVDYEVGVHELLDGTGRTIGRVVVARDVSVERRAERELRERVATIEELRRRLAHEVDHDALTGLSNRRRLDAVLSAAALSGDRYAVALLDVDRFKSVNDHWGHVVGDQVLVQVAATLRTCESPDVQVGRWGGEEFVLVIRGDAVDLATQIAERVRQAAVSRPAKVDEQLIPWTVSIGVAVVPGRTAPEQAVANADHALYGAKRHGRNRVETVAQLRSGPIVPQPGSGRGRRSRRVPDAVPTAAEQV